jgi:hypothetical protein
MIWCKSPIAIFNEVPGAIESLVAEIWLAEKGKPHSAPLGRGIRDSVGDRRAEFAGDLIPNFVSANAHLFEVPPSTPDWWWNRSMTRQGCHCAASGPLSEPPTRASQRSKVARTARRNIYVSGCLGTPQGGRNPKLNEPDTKHKSNSRRRSAVHRHCVMTAKLPPHRRSPAAIRSRPARFRYRPSAPPRWKTAAAALGRWAVRSR